MAPIKEPVEILGAWLRWPS